MIPAAYPIVLHEEATLELVCQGQSLARYGDGEFKLCRGAGIKSQSFDERLMVQLRRILTEPSRCLVGIPNIHSATPKSGFWDKYVHAADLLGARGYVSSFITRPDSAPWIDTASYWARLECLWVGREVTLVRGSSKSLTADDLVGALRVHEVIAPRQHAWASYEDLLGRVGRPPHSVLICLGPTATVMAWELSMAGVHAVDLGHVGLFLRKHRRGDPMWVTKEDKGAPAS